MDPFNLTWLEYHARGPYIERVDVRLIVLLSDLNDYTNGKLWVHCLYDNARIPDNLHRRGLAADGHIEGMSLIDQYICISRFPFKGIGLYSYWNNPGFHVDLRARKIGARWGCREKGDYVELNETFLRG